MKDQINDHEEGDHALLQIWLQSLGVAWLQAGLR